MLKSKTDFEVRKLAIEAGPFEKKRVVHFRRKKNNASTKRVSLSSPQSSV
jgi:hypothetical protein